MHPTSIIFYNIFVCFSIGLISIINIRQIYKKYAHEKEAVYFAWAWLVTGFLWISAGVGVIFYYRGLWQIDYLIFQYSVEFFTAISPFVYGLYVFNRIFHKKIIAKTGAIIAGILGIIYYISSLYYGMAGPIRTSFGADYVQSEFSNIFFKLMFTPVFLGMIYIFIRQIFFWIKTKKIHDFYKFSAIFSMVLYAIVAYFEKMGLYLDWHLFLARLLVLISVLIAYLAYNFKTLRADEAMPPR